MKEEEPRLHLTRICRLAYDRRLLDSAGGNVTHRQGDRIYMTRSFAGPRHQWDLRPEDILVLDLEGNILAGEGVLSREAKVHLLCYRELPQAGAVFHAHSLNLMPFIALEKPLPPMTEQTDKYGEIGYCSWAPAHSPDLATHVVERLRPQAAKIAEHPVAVMAPRHGIFVAGADLDAAYDCLERLDRNAYVALMSRLLS